MMKAFFEKFKMRDKGTILRTIFLILSLINYVISMVGKKYWGSGSIYEYVSFGIFVLMVVISYWYNNNWTGFASMADDIFNRLADGKITEEEVIEFRNKHKKDCIELNHKDSGQKKKEDSNQDEVEHK